jgi:hypothetical protein
MNDAMKLAARRILGEQADAIILFADDEAARHFESERAWHSTALREARIRIEVAELSEDLRRSIRQAQMRQYR